MNDKEYLYKEFSQKQEKYTYYIIALSITAIGFSIHKTTGIPLNKSHILLGLAVLSWGTSAYCGLLFVRYIISTIFANINLIDTLNGENPLSGKNPELIELGAKTIKKILNDNSDKTMKLHKRQNLFFSLGIILFIIWHILEMYLLTI